MQTTNTVAELATAIPRAIPVLERFKIDYCCHGNQSIAEACTRSGITADELLMSIENEPSATSTAPDSTLGELMRYITDTHHGFTRTALVTLQRLTMKVRQVHGANHPELELLETLVREVTADLLPHMLKEEQVLFPYVTALESSIASGNDAPVPFFGTVRNPVRMMMSEHEAVGEKMAEIRDVTSDYILPEDSCGSYRGLFDLLQELEGDLHRHIHLENNILFPRAIAMEGERNAAFAGALGDHCCA